MANKKGRHNSAVTPVDIEPLIREVEAVKKLLALLLAKLGSDSAEIAAALGLESSTVRRWITFRDVKKLSMVETEGNK